MSRKKRLDSLFHAALEIPSPEERAEYLTRACGEDAALRREIEALLRADSQAGDFLAQPARDAHRAPPGPGRDAYGSGAALDDAGQPVGDTDRSVLASLCRNLSTIPRVVLRQAQEQEGLVERPRSKELPASGVGSRYQLHGEIARGGMGVILKGRDADLGRDLAIKVLLDAHKGRPEVIERFIEEAQIGGQLQHPGIVPVYQLGQFGDERPFFTMKLVKGKTLAHLLSARDTASDDRAHLLGVFEQVCQTMAYAHSRGVIHRDLKPSNIMVGAFGEVQVMDWGLAKVLAEGGIADEARSRERQQEVSVIRTRRSTGSDVPEDVGSHTKMGSVMGTPAYMPPEQALGEVDRLDERADVFGLGALLCEILTGKPPYVGKDSEDVFRQARRGALDDCFARLDASGAEEGLLDLTKRALAAEPDNRLGDAGVVAQGITDYLAGVEERLRASELAQARAQTRRKLSVAIAALMLVLAMGSGLTAWYFHLLHQEQFRLAHAAQEAGQAEKSKSQQLARELRVSRVMRLAALSQSLQQQRPVQSLLLALEAVETTRRHDGTVMPTAHQALLSASADLAGLPLGEAAATTALAVSSDSRWLVAGTATGTIRRWEMEQGKPNSLTLLEGHQDRITGMAVSADGQQFASVSDDGTARLWDFASGDPAVGSTVVLAVPGMRLVSVDLDPQGRWLIAGSEDGAAWLCDLRDAGAEPTVLKGHNWDVRLAEFSPDGRWLVTGGLRTPQLWDLESENAPTAQSLTVDSATRFVADCLSFTPDSRRLIVGGRPQLARIWDLTGEAPRLAQELRAFDGHVSNVVVSPAGDRLVTSDLDSARVWRLDEEGLFQPVRVLRGHQGFVTELAFGSEGRWLVTGSDDKTTRVWDLAPDAPSASAMVLRGHDEPIDWIAISPDRRWFATAGYDGARLWAFPHRQAGATSHVLRGPQRSISALAVSQDGQWLAAASALSIWLWRIEGDTVSLAHVLTGNEGKINSVKISPNGQWLLSGDEAMKVCLWRLDSGDIPSTLRMLDGHKRTIGGVQISQDSRWALTRDHDGFVQVWDLQADDPGNAPLVLKAGYGRGVSTAVMTPDSRWTLTASWDHTARVWDMHREDPATKPTVLRHDNIVSRAAISPNGRWVVTGKAYATDQHKALLLWDLFAEAPESSSRLLRADFDSYSVSGDRRWTLTTKGTTAHLLDIYAEDPRASTRVLDTPGWKISAHEVSPTGRFMVTSGNGKAHLWDLAGEDAAVTQTALSFAGERVTTVAMSPDERWAITGSANGTVCLWDLDVATLVARARRLAGRELSPEENSEFLIDSQL